MFPSVDKVLQTVSLAEVESSATYVSFALKLYHQQHGELPDTLVALVPEYIREVPMDPFDGEPLRYSKAKAILYSVGNDFVDEGGSALPARHSLGEDDDWDVCAERDATEPTFLLQFASPQ